MSYSYSSFGSLLSSAGNSSLAAFQSNSKYMNALSSISLKNSYTNTYKGFNTSSIFDVGTSGQTDSYTGSYSTSSGYLEKNFWSLVGSYTASSGSTTSTSTTTEKVKNYTTTNISAAANAESVSDLISLLPKSSSLSQMSSYFA